MQGNETRQQARTATLWALTAIVLTGCLSEGTEDQPDADTDFDAQLTGSVGDGPVIGASIRIFGNDGSQLAELESDANAGYNIVIRTQGKHYPLIIDARNGTDIVTGLPPDFTLVGAATEPGKKSVANINPFSTLAVEIASELGGGATKANIQAAEDIVTDSVNSGLTTLVSSGPMSTPIDHGNIAEIVKASETLGETIRRTRDWLNAFGFASNGDTVIQAIGSDLTDQVIDGSGGRRSDPRIAAVFTIVTAQVLLEAMTNELKVNGVDSTAALESAIARVMPGAVSPTLGELTVTAQMLRATVTGLDALAGVVDDPRLDALRQAVAGLRAGLEPALVRSLLAAGHSSLLDEFLPLVADGSTVTIDTINGIVRTGSSTGTSNRAPTISGTPPTQVAAGTTYSFTPTATDADGDQLSFTATGLPLWATLSPSTGLISGAPDAGDIGTYSGITITVTDGAATASLGPFSIDVLDTGGATGSAVLSWAAPTQNEDGTPLTNLAGYRLYWGTNAGNYTSSVTISNPGVTTYVVENLLPGSYEFVATAFNNAGVESAFSNSATKIVQ